MKATTVSPLDINRHVRKVCVRHWLDLGHLSVHTCAGHVYVRGTLAKLPGLSQVMLPAEIRAIFDEIRQGPGVHRITTDLTNWAEDIAGIWHPKAARPETGIPPQGYSAKPGHEGPTTFTIETDEKET